MDGYRQGQATAASAAAAASIVGHKRPAPAVAVSDEPLSREAKRAVMAEKAFACDECDYRCTCSDHLRRHQMTHTGEKPFVCDQCDYRCSRRGDLRSHQRTHSL